MASSQIAAMLDELMGRNRNLAPDDAANREIKWTDPDVCRYYLVHFCPHDLFTNTKADLGPCGKIHDDDLKQKFADEKESYKKSQYLDEFLRFCQKSLADLQARIKKAKERLILTQQAEEAKLNAGGMGVSGGQNREVDEKIILLSEKISALVAEAEQAGCRGDVEEAQGLMKLCDQLRDERDTLRRTVAVSNYGNDYGTIQKAMEVCDICGAFLIVGDAQQRIDDHLLGKQHVGYARLRAAVDQLMEQRRLFREGREKEAEDRRKLKEAKEAEEAKEAKEAKPEKSSTTETSSSSSTKKRSRSKDRDRDRDRDRGDRDTRRRGGSRDRDRSDRDRRDRDQRRNNDRDRDRNRGDRRRDRGRRDRSRSRDRDRHSKRRRDSRSRSRDRNHSSSSKKDSSKSPSREATTTEQQLQQLPKVDPAPKVIDPAGPEVNDEVGEAAVPMVADGASPAKVVNDDAAAPPPAGSGNNGHQD